VSLQKGGFVFSAPNYHAIRRLVKNQRARFSEGDVLVLFGELFQRGYANGLVEEAERRGMKIVRATVGRREKDGTLRPLLDHEKPQSPGPFINIPLEAGFDLEVASDGLSPVERVKDVKLSDWESCRLRQEQLIESRDAGRLRFQKNVQAFMKELQAHIPAGQNLLFAHLMAGGVPRAKIVLPLMNRVVKGTGDRYLPSQKFWDSDLGQWCKMSFHEVTAKTFDILVSESQTLRQHVQSQGGFVSYSAYGYHGTEVLDRDQMTWQTYSPYLQGWAKKDLEGFSRQWNQKGMRTAVYNCPEILTNSSSIFQGVEIPLYPLLKSVKKLDPNSPLTIRLWENCQALLKPGTRLEQLLEICHRTINLPVVKDHSHFSQWPQHSSNLQLEAILEASEKLTSAHADVKNLMTSILSEVVFSSCGKTMLEDCSHPEAPVSWLGHDLVAQAYLQS